MRPFIYLALLVSSVLVAPTAIAQSHSERVECASKDYRLTRCGAPWGDARLVRQSSESTCSKGSTWGVDREGLWVNKGCAGVFEIAGRGYDQGQSNRGDDRDHGQYGRGDDHRSGEWRPGRGWDQDIRFRCASRDYNYNFCQVDVGRGGRIYVERQISDNRCVEGQSWGYNRAGVWVTSGCEAQFVIERRWR